MVDRLIEEVEAKIRKFFLNDISFIVNDKTIKKGKLINAHIKDFFIEFKLEVQKGGIKTFELPYPFMMKEFNTHIVFDYQLSRFVNDDLLLLAKVRRMKPKKNSKFYYVNLILRKNEEKLL